MDKIKLRLKRLFYHCYTTLCYIELELLSIERKKVKIYVQSTVGQSGQKYLQNKHIFSRSNQSSKPGFFFSYSLSD